jgi:RNA polymerase sigma-70 factor, ECF subfamily
MSDVDDVDLLQRARRGDEAAFSRLFERYQRGLYRYAAYMCGRDTGDDIVQETFLVVLRQGTRRDAPQMGVSNYLFGIARHLVMKRMASRHEFQLADSSEKEHDEAMAADQPSVLDDMTRAEMIHAVRAAVLSLPSSYREVVVLCDLQEMAYDDAANLMQVPIGTVRSRLHRARSLLTMKLAANAARETGGRDAEA